MTNIVREQSNLASNVTVIKRQTVRADHTPIIELKRVAAYCRVSTDLEAQQSSIDLQMSSYKRIIEEHPGWVLAGIYADDGETGTSVENRPEFQRMYADAMAGCFDILLVKSVSRFARNTKDSLEYTRELKAHGVSVYFEKEGLDTSGFTSEFLLTIFAAFAQEESRSISENVKRGIRNRYKLGKPPWRATYGFRKGYVVYEPEAEVIREIFDLYNEDISTQQIADILNEKKALLPSGCKKWVKGMINRVISNEKYIGDVLMENHKDARIKRSRFSNACNVGFSCVMNGAYILGIGYCGYGILTGTMSYGNLMAIMQLIGQVQNPFANITGYLPKYYSMLASAERLMEAEGFETDRENRMTQEQMLDFYRSDFESIHLEHACFTYQPPVQTEGARPPMPVVLKDVNLEIKKGEYIVFTGPSGCGKSTILKLLMCLYSLDSGNIFLKTKDGEKSLTSSYRKLFAYVPQGNQLLSGSIRDIVTFKDEKRLKDDGEINKALTIACAQEFVMRLDKGLDTVLGERGLGLSEGQMQRIAIARAVFSDRPILLLDEATSALDEETSCQLLNNLHSMTDRTVILVTHRLNQLSIFDKELAFLQNGIRIIERNNI